MTVHMRNPAVRDAESVFQSAADLPDHQRDAFVAQQCADDAGLLSEVSSLVAHFRAAEGRFMVGMAPGMDRATDDALPQRVGSFEVIRLIGEGGMGVVYEARQDNPRRVVALKLMRSGIAARDTLRRFQFEGNVLGQLQHPGIAQIFEAGMAPVQTRYGISPPAPYFVMELVTGETLLRHADARRLTARERLLLMAQVCDAVEHAHQRGVIHRDLKPANILVDDAGHPKVLDFGVARLLHGEGPGRSMLTSAGALIGTLPYMSPEQVQGRAGDVDTRSDVFSLGVMLFELLTGSLPFATGNSDLTEVVRSLRDDEPRRASRCNSQLRGDIDAICAAALHKNHQRRYQSASRLADDIRRHLEGRPIEARRDSALYVLRKNLWRYRWMVGVAAMLMVVIAAFGVVSAIQADRNQQLAADLSQSLSESNVERGRLYGSSNLTAAEALLWPEFLRHQESPLAYWALWSLYAANPCVAAGRAHQATVNTAAYSPDGTRLVTGSRDGCVLVWNAADYELIAALPGDERVVHRVAFSPAGAAEKLLAVAGNSGYVCLWRADTLEPAGQLQVGTRGSRAMSFSPDGARLYLGSATGRVREWDVGTQSLVRNTRAHRAEITRLLPIASRSLLAIAATGEVRLCRIDTMEQVGSLPHANGIYGLAVSHDGNWLATGGKDKFVRLWNLDTLECKDAFAAANGTVRHVAFSEDGTSLLVAGWYRVDRWDLRTHERRTIVNLGMAPLGGSDPGPTSNLVIGDPHNGDLRIAEIGPGACRPLESASMCVGAASVSHDGTLVACPDASGNIGTWELSTGADCSSIAGRKARSVLFHPSSPLLAICTTAGTLSLLDYARNEIVHTEKDMGGANRMTVAFHPDGVHMAVVRANGSVEVVGMRTGGVVAALPAIEGATLTIRYSPDGRWLAVLSRGRVARLWDMATGQVQRLQLSNGPWKCEFSPDGAVLAIGCWHGCLEFWEVATAQRIRSLVIPAGIFWSVAYRPGEPGVLATGSADGTVRLFDTHNYHELLVLDPFNGHDVLSVEFTPDGQQLVAAATDSLVHVWDLRFSDRIIAANLEYQIHLNEARGIDPAVIQARRDWAARVRSESQN